MTYELGYIRYDDDIDGFKEAAKRGFQSNILVTIMMLITHNRQPLK